MYQPKKKHLNFFLGLAISVVCVLVFFSVAPTVLAQANVQNGDVFGTQQIDSTVALGTDSLQKTVVRIINVGLGLLGIIAVGIVLYGGFIYMTSGGNEDKVAQAKKILVNGTIGLVIILSAWAITSFVLNKLGEATGVKGLGNDVPSACRDAQFANDNPDQCFGADFDIPGGENIECAVKNKKVLLTRGITPSIGGTKTPTGMNNVKVRVLFNNPLLQNDPAQVFDIYRVENGQEVTTTASFALRFVNNDPALLDAVFQGQNGLDQLPQGEYHVKVKRDLKGANGQNLVERVSCGEYPAQASFTVNTDGVIDNQAPVAGPVFLNGRAADPVGEQLNRGHVQTFNFNLTDNTGIGVVQYHVVVSKDNHQLSDFDYFDIPKISRGSLATNQDPFVTKFPLIIPGNAELFSEYNITATAFDIDGNSVQVLFKGIIVGANCQPGDKSAECLDDARACNSDLQCPSKKCVNNQCVAWPVITNVNGDSSIWDGATGNYVTVEGNYFGENSGHVYFGFEKQGAGGGIQWVEAIQPQCDARDLWHNDWIIVSIPDDVALPVGTQAILKVERAAEVGQAEVLFDTTIDNHGPIPGPNHGRFTKSNTKRPGICSVGVIDHPTIPAGATVAPPNTSLKILGTAFGDPAQGTVRFGTAQGEVSGWSDDAVRTRIPATMRPGKIGISVTQSGIPSNNFPFVVSSTIDTSRPRIISIDPVTTTRKSYVTIVGQGFGESPGQVFLAPDAATTCRLPNGALNVNVCQLMDTRTCGQTWTSTQIIAQVPENIEFKQWIVKIERGGDLVTSEDQTQLGVEEGAPNPGICYFSPNAGPAPLPVGSPGLKFKGINFSDAPKIYFWPKGADEKNIDGWLVQKGDALHRIERESFGPIVSVTTSIPVDANGLTLSKGPAPIRVKNANGGISNSVVYTVSDCKNEAPLPGYQCCTEGPDAGFFKPNGQICKGQVRDAGYAWRFTTGRIPEIPQVVEQCVTSTPPGDQPIFPSPAPWKNWLGNDLACINQNIVVQFRLPENAILPNLNANTVKVFTCAEGVGGPDCSGDKKVLVPYDNNDLELSGSNYLTIINNPIQGPSQLQTSTWYRVELSKTIESVRNVAVANGEQEERQRLMVSRSCNNDTAYCFDFKTGGDNNRCLLDSVGVIPNPNTVDYLGVLQLPFFYDPTTILNPSPSNTLYYKVWGAGSQDCSVLNVRGYGWHWDSTDAAKATAARTQERDDKATVTSLQNTVPGTVGIRASSSTSEGNKVGMADLTINLGDPEVVNFWPSCTESCTEAELGVEFNRQMLQSSFAPNIALVKCSNELCDDPAHNEFIPVNPSSQDYFTYRFTPVSGELEKATWYKVIVSAEIQGVGSLGELQDENSPQDDVGGKHMKESFSWRFRTTNAPDGKCVADKVVIEPKNFVARHIGERTKYNAFPKTAPNKCSKLGQDLNPWVYGWEWKVLDRTTGQPAGAGHEVATVTDFSLQGKIKPYCGLTCLPLGSDTAEIPNGHYPICGDGVIGPGEDCELGGANNPEVPGVTCTLNCLRPGNTVSGGNQNAVECGNGLIDNPASNGHQGGEECDFRIPGQSSFCTNTCLWKGGSPQVQNASTTAWCGSRSKTLGEDCDIADTATTTPQGKIGCSQQCLHVGTPLSKEWCLVHGSELIGRGTNPIVISETPQCKAALSVCGNGVVEAGEECEYIQDGVAPGVQVALNVETHQTVTALTNSKTVCNSRCLLTNICGLNAIPLVANGGPRCESGTEGCTNGCRVTGSSVTYEQQSFCGDAVVGVGEYPMCEYAPGALGIPASLGGNPVQMVTAVGKGALNNQSRSQEADISAQLLTRRNAEGEVVPSANRPTGKEKYSLQCGYSETAPPAPPVVEIFAADSANDADMELNNSVWIFNALHLEKSSDQHVSGQKSLHVTGRGILARELHQGVLPGKIYHLSFQYKLNSGGFWAFGFASTTANTLRSAEVPVLSKNDASHVEEDLQFHSVSTTAPQANWQTYERDITFPSLQNGHYGLSLRGIENSDFYIDDVKLEQAPDFSLVNTVNDCPGNADNSSGVGTNSCCFPRSHRVSSIPTFGRTRVCRNAFISVDFNGFIDEKSIQNNTLVLVSGHEAGFTCGVGETDVSANIQTLLESADLALNVEHPGFFHRMWNNVKHFFARIFGLEEVYASNDVSVWCMHPNALIPTIAYQSAPDFSSTTSTVSLALTDVLLPRTSYLVVFTGGSDGVKDIQGVGIRSANGLQNGKYLSTDFIGFKTGDDICKIDHLEVQPESYLFTTPNSTSTFAAKVISTSEDQQIESLPFIYAWEWYWLPGNNPLFNIPLVGTPTNTASIVIGAKNVEGNLTASALARVTRDVSLENNHQGRVFSKSFELTSNFCENPWPPRDYFPYQEGIPFGETKNEDGINAVGVFNGSELKPVRVGNSEMYFNVSFGYCADANRSGTTTDDLPYLKPLVFGNTLGPGVCKTSDGFRGQNPLEGRACGSDTMCRKFDPNGVCGGRPVVHDPALTGNNVFKKFLFVTDKNDDAIGLQISGNPNRLSARAWYENEFPGSNTQALRAITVAGYDGVTDGKNYYINALNQNGSPTSIVYNNIYIFSINDNAQDGTKKVFEQILTSLKFNINISDIGYCLAPAQNEGAVNHQTLVENFDRLTEITSLACQSDFDCHDADGVVLSQTNGVCSNAKTKMLRDWKRLRDVSLTQKKFELYKSGDGAGMYPQLDAGSFVTGYSNSRWGSWNLIDKAIGGTPHDPLDTWTQCGEFDTQTCWNAASSTVHCPLLSSIFEYSVVTSSGYRLHVPLEYFTFRNPSIGSTDGKIKINLDQVTTDPWCQPASVISAVAGQCGNGVVNVASGEECDSVAEVQRGPMGYLNPVLGHCAIQDTHQCMIDGECGKYITLRLEAEQVDGGVAPPAPRPYSGVVRDGLGACMGPTNIQARYILNVDSVHGQNVDLFACNTNADCQSPEKYAGVRNLRFFNELGDATHLGVVVGHDAFITQVVNRQNPENPSTMLHCAGGNSDSSSAVVRAAENAIAAVIRSSYQPIQCLGVVDGGALNNCPVNTTAPFSCGHDCKIQYGHCSADHQCGNSRVEGNEACDSGPLNGSYGHCNAECTGPFEAYCGNGEIDRHGAHDVEACDQVPYVELSIPVAGSHANKFRAVYGTTYDIQDFCHRTAPDGEAACAIVLAGFAGPLLQFNNDPGVLTHYCENDPKLLCDPARKEANTRRDLDCLAPRSQNVLDFRRYNTENPELDDYISRDITYYGPCTAKVGNQFGSSYNTNKNLSCNGSCSAVGEYCGDGKVQSTYESCDDGNTISGDGCTSLCKEEVVVANNNVPVAPVNPLCGNGKIDVVEVCDISYPDASSPGGLFNANGIKCNPQYGRSCTYCSSDCRQILTVDPVEFCGNNIFSKASEKCDVVNGSLMTASSTLNNREVAIRCDDNFKGAYSCNQCTTLTNTCVQCGQKSMNEGAVLPRMTYLIPMLADPANNIWIDNDAGDQDDNSYKFYVKESVQAGRTGIDFSTVNNPPTANIVGGGFGGVGGVHFYEYLDILTAKDFLKNMHTPQPLLNDNTKGLESNALCNTEYGLVLNTQKLKDEAHATCLPGQNDCDTGSYLMSDKEDFFPFDISNPANRGADQEFIFSPAVPENYIRVVVRWPKILTDLGYEFQGLLYNSTFNQNGRGTIRPSTLANNVKSGTIELLGQGASYLKYWLPSDNDPAKFLQNSVYVHPPIHGNVYSIQSMTINMTGGPNAAQADGQGDYAFFVEALSSQIQTSIGALFDGDVISASTDVFVDVYEYHPGQSPKYSVYQPTKTYRLSFVGGNVNPSALYWHVFNLVYNKDDGTDRNGDNELNHHKFTVEPPTSGRGTQYQTGKIATCVYDVLCYTPRNACRPEQCQVN